MCKIIIFLKKPAKWPKWIIFPHNFSLCDLKIAFYNIALLICFWLLLSFSYHASLKYEMDNIISSVLVLPRTVSSIHWCSTRSKRPCWPTRERSGWAPSTKRRSPTSSQRVSSQMARVSPVLNWQRGASLRQENWTAGSRRSWRPRCGTPTTSSRTPRLTSSWW